MDDFFVSIPVSDQKNICVSSLTASELMSEDVTHIGNDFGLFAYETSIENPNEIEIIAKFASRDAAEKLVRVLERAFRASGINRPIERCCTYADHA
jgi:hypothetical protein